MEHHFPSCVNDAIQQGHPSACWDEGESALGQDEGSKQGVSGDEKSQETGGLSPARLSMCGEAGPEQARGPSLGKDPQEGGSQSPSGSEEAVGGRPPPEAPSATPTGKEAMTEPGGRDGAGWRQEPPSPEGGAVSRAAPSPNEGLGIPQGAQSLPEPSPGREALSPDPACFSQESDDALKPRSISRGSPGPPLGAPEGHHGDAGLGPKLQHAVCLPLVSEGLQLLWIQSEQTGELDGVRELAEAFSTFPYPTQQEAASLARSCALPLDRVKAWFMVQRIRYGISWATEEIEEARHKVFGPPPPGTCTSPAGGRPLEDPDSVPPRTRAGRFPPQPHRGPHVSASPMFAVAPPCGRPQGRNGNSRVWRCGFEGGGWPSEAEIRRLRAKTGLARIDIQRWFADGRRRQRELMERLGRARHRRLGPHGAGERDRRLGPHGAGERLSVRGEGGTAGDAGDSSEEGPCCSPALGACGRLRRRTREQLQQHFLRCLRTGGRGNRKGRLRGVGSGREQGAANQKGQHTRGAGPEGDRWRRFGEDAPQHYSVVHVGTDRQAKAHAAGVTGCSADLHPEGALQARGADDMSQERGRVWVLCEAGRRGEVGVGISDWDML